jgi:hypothetical protein
MDVFMTAVILHVEGANNTGNAHLTMRRIRVTIVTMEKQ